MSPIEDETAPWTDDSLAQTNFQNVLKFGDHLFHPRKSIDSADLSRHPFNLTKLKLTDHVEESCASAYTLLLEFS
ncbi:hypothetical protein ACTXT7_001642 [Hymenolepis weldensis]